MSRSLFITVASTPGCMRCKTTSRTMDRYEIHHTYTDVSEDLETGAVVKALGYAEAPVVLVHDEDGRIVDHWGGHRPDLIKALAADLAGQTV